MLARMSAPTFAEALRSARERAGLTQQELAERAQLTPHAVSALERGTRTRPYPHTVRALAEALGLTDRERADLQALIPRRGTAAAVASPAEPDPVETPGKRPVFPARLAVPPTPLFGRDEDVDAVAGLLRDGHRLVSLIGPGGVGKTRLAAAVADRIACEYPDGVVSLSLVSVTSSADVVPTLASALDAAAGDEDALTAALAGRRLLLVLDNLEHLLSIAPVVDRLVAGAPLLRVLTTSRSPLRLRAEREYAVTPLAVAGDSVSGLDELASAPAGALAVDRALAVGADLRDEDAPALAELGRRLAGLPLAIELAVAQVRVLRPDALLARLEETLDAPGARDLPERQRTMRATLDWSYGLLDLDQQRLFRLLGIFRGGAALPAIEAVAGRPVLPLLTDLVAQSLVVRQDGVEPRFTLLEPVAQYARSLLVGDEANAAARAHAAYGEVLARQAARGFEGPDAVEWLTRIESAESNLVVAIERSLDLGDADTAGWITWHLWLYWWLRGRFATGVRLAALCLEADLSPVVRARVHLALATMAYAGGDPTRAGIHWEASYALGTELGDAEVVAKSRAGMGLAALAEGDLDRAGRFFTESLDHAGAAGPESDWIPSLTQVWLGTVHLLRGDARAAEEAIGAGLSLARGRRDRLATYVALFNRAQARLARADHDGARTDLVEGIRLSQETADLANLAFFLESVAVLDAPTDATRVPHLLGAATGLREEVGAAVYGYYLPDVALQEQAAHDARAVLGEAYDDAVDRARTWSVEQIVDYALRTPTT